MSLKPLAIVFQTQIHTGISLCLSATILVLTTPFARSQPPSTSSNTDLAPAMEKVMTAVYKPDIPGATVIVVKNGRVIFRKGYGLANLELKTPMRPEMVFRLCSVTKQFTAAAILMLAEQGKLALDDDITKFFPDYPTAGKKISIENLLTHTSGIKDYLDKLWPESMRRDFRPDRLIDLFKKEPLESAPGTRESYSNSNYVLLGAIIENTSGKEYGRFIEDNIFRPLGMKHSYYEGVQDLIPNRVSGYARVSEGFVNAAYVSMTQLYAAGGLCSSVDDLALWDAALSSDRLLKQGSVTRMFTPYKLTDGEVADYGYGWVISRFQGRTIASHGGGMPGFTNFVLRMPQDQVYVAILSNDRTAEVQPEYVANRIAAIAIGKPIPESRVIKLEPKILDTYAGRYEERADEILTIRREGDSLLAQGSDGPEFKLYPISDDTFLVKAFDGQLSFVKDAQGKVTGLIARHDEQNTRYKKRK